MTTETKRGEWKARKEEVYRYGDLSMGDPVARCYDHLQAQTLANYLNALEACAEAAAAVVDEVPAGTNWPALAQLQRSLVALKEARGG